MGSKSWRRVLRLGLTFFVASNLAAQREAERRLVVLFDTSRSIPQVSFRDGLEVAQTLGALGSDGIGIDLWSVDDRGEFRGGLEALAQLERRGRRTLLHDALLAAIRAAGRGGVVLLISDAIDDGSATSAEDVGRIARELDVPIYAVGMGRVNEQALRRLALLSGGVVLGRVEKLDRGQMLSQLQSAWREREPPAPPAPPAPTPALPLPQEEAPPAPPSREGLFSQWFLLWVGLVALAGAGLGAFIAARAQRKRREPEGGTEADYGTSPGVHPTNPAAEASSEVWEELDPVRIAEIKSLAPVRNGGLLEVPPKQLDAPFDLPRDQVFEKTLVLQDEVVLAVHEPGQSVKVYKLPERRAVWIGRDPARNTLAFSDPTLSGQHLRLVLCGDGAVELVDSDSTNGTFVRDRKIRSGRLKSGAQFRAGLLEFELRLLHRSPT